MELAEWILGVNVDGTIQGDQGILGLLQCVLYLKRDHHIMDAGKYRQVSNIRRTQSRHLKDSHTVLRLSLPNPLKPDVKSRMKM